MNKHVTKFIKHVRYGFGKHSSEILLGIGIVSGITTTALAIKATPRALELLKEEKELYKANDRNDSAKEDKNDALCLSLPQIVKITWKCYISTAVSGLVSIACLIGSHSANAKRNAALATAYKLSEMAFLEYKDAVLKEIGEEKEHSIREKILQKKIDNAPPVNNSTVYISPGSGDMLCFDSISGRYFESSVNKINQAINAINRILTYDMYVSLTEFYDELGLEPTGVSDMLGWNIDQGLVEINFGTRLSENGVPCIVLDYLVSPKYDYSKLS